MVQRSGGAAAVVRSENSDRLCRGKRQYSGAIATPRASVSGSVIPQLQTLLATLVLAVFLGVSPAGADDLTAVQFKKMILGNTLHEKVWSKRRNEELEFMFHFIDDKKLLFSSAQSAPTATLEWTATDDGGFCYLHTHGQDREQCFRTFRVEGSK